MKLTATQRQEILKNFPELKDWFEIQDTKEGFFSLTSLVKEIKDKLDKLPVPKDGFTPVKGKDYWTEEDVSKVVSDILEKATPIKGVHYFDGAKGDRGDDGTDGKSIKGQPGNDGKNGKDGSPDTPLQIADKLNTLQEVVDVSVIKGAVKVKDFQLLDKKILDGMAAIDGRVKAVDQRWHGAGLSRVSTDTTLTGNGTPSSPLHVVSSGGGTPALPFTSIQFNNAGAFGGDANVTINGAGKINLNTDGSASFGSGGLSIGSSGTILGSLAVQGSVLLGGDLFIFTPGRSVLTFQNDFLTHMNLIKSDGSNNVVIGQTNANGVVTQTVGGYTILDSDGNLLINRATDSGIPGDMIQIEGNNPRISLHNLGNDDLAFIRASGGEFSIINSNAFDPTQFAGFHIQYGGGNIEYTNATSGTSVGGHVWDIADSGGSHVTLYLDQLTFGANVPHVLRVGVTTCIGDPTTIGDNGSGAVIQANGNITVANKLFSLAGSDLNLNSGDNAAVLIGAGVDTITGATGGGITLLGGNNSNGAINISGGEASGGGAPIGSIILNPDGGSVLIHNTTDDGSGSVLQVLGNTNLKAGTVLFTPAGAQPSLTIWSDITNGNNNAFGVLSNDNASDGGVIIKPSMNTQYGFAEDIGGIQGTNSDLNAATNLEIQGEGGNLYIGAMADDGSGIKVQVTGGINVSDNFYINGVPITAPANYWTLTGSDIYNNSGGKVFVNQSSDDGSGAKLQVTGGINNNTGTIRTVNAGTESAIYGDSFTAGLSLKNGTQIWALNVGPTTGGIDFGFYNVALSANAFSVAGATSKSTWSYDMNINAKIAKYNSITTVSNGVPSELGTADLTAQTAAKAATTIYTPTATGMFRISVYLQVTTAASVSSVLGGAGGVVITYNDGDGNVAQSDTVALATTAGAIAINAAGNTTATNLTGSIVIYAKTGVAIQYAIGYTSSGTAMQYAAHLKLEAL